MTRNISEIAKDAQYEADKRNYSFDAVLLSDVFEYQFEKYHKDKGITKKDFKDCRLNELLETIIKYNGTTKNLTKRIR